MKAILTGLLAIPASVEQGFLGTASHNSWTLLSDTLHTGQAVILYGSISWEHIIQTDSVSLTLPPLLCVIF